MPRGSWGDWLLPLSWLVVGIALWPELQRAGCAVLRRMRRANFYKSIVESQAELICRYGPDTRLTYVNEAYCRYFGRTREQLLGQSFFALLPEAAHESARENVKRLLASRRPVLYEHEVFRPDGTSSWQQWLDYLILDGRGKILEVQAVGRDITDLRSTRQRLERQQDELVHLSRVALLGQLTGPLAHEISQPVASILSNAQATLKLLEQPNTQRASLQEIVQDIADGAERARLTIHSLRCLLRPGQSAPAPLDLNELVSDTSAFMRSALQMHQIQVRLCLAAELPPVLADRIQLQQVLMNLLINACDAMEGLEREPRIIVISTHRSCDGRIECAIRDTGTGIAPECLPRIFDAYFSTKKNGLGLGLSISRSILDAHRGELWAVNNAGPGATFSFALPAVV